MLRLHCLAAVVAAAGFAADPPALLTAHGTVDRVEKNSLTVRPREPDGKFGKSIVLQLTGTSKITTLSPQTRAGKVVLTQIDTDAKDLKPRQTIAVIYSEATTPVMLSAVVQPPGGK